MNIADRGIRTLPGGLVHPGNGRTHAAAGARRHVVSLNVSNKPGVLVRVALVFARRGCNIDGLVVSEAHDPAFSHMTVTASGSEDTLRLILGQLDKLVDVIHAEDRTGEDHAHTGDPLVARGEETSQGEETR